MVSNEVVFKTDNDDVLSKYTDKSIHNNRPRRLRKKTDFLVDYPVLPK